MTSIYIPRIDSNVTISQIKNILENVFNLGTIQRIECCYYEDFFYCFIFFHSWNVNKHADYILSRLQNNQSTRIFHKDITNDWLIFKNNCEMSFYRDPIHMDLTLEVFSDIRPESIISIVNSLNIGKVHSIETIPFHDLNRFNKLKSNFICIHFEYWYRTKYTYNLQEQILHDKYVKININQSINHINPEKIDNYFWTFYPQHPRFHGINPNIWTLSEDENVSSLTTESIDDILSNSEFSTSIPMNPNTITNLESISEEINTKIDSVIV